MTPSGSTRHHALAIKTNDGRESDFDFLAEPPGYQRHLIPFKWVFRIAIFVVLISLLVLVIVDLRKTQEDKSNATDPLNAARCFYITGGGKSPEGSSRTTDDLLSFSCLNYYRQYFGDDGRYQQDTEEAIADGKHLLKDVTYQKMVVFDIDETALSNIPFLQSNDFAPKTEDRIAWNIAGRSPAIAATLQYYKARNASPVAYHTDLRSHGYSIAFITGRNENARSGTRKNLKRAGYGSQCSTSSPSTDDLCYVRLIMREVDDQRDAMVYKSVERKKLMDEGFDIVGGVGDQWSDLLGTDRPATVIKMPNPIYFIL